MFQGHVTANLSSKGKEAGTETAGHIILEPRTQRSK